MERILRRLPQTLIVGLTALLAPFCLAQTGEPPRQYEIELLVFQNLVKNDGGESWPIDYSGWFDETVEETQSPPLHSPTVNWLPRKNRRLSAQYNTLRRSAQYRPVDYIAWRQAVLDRKEAQAIELPARDRDAAEAYVDGSVTVAVERYLHLYLDLQFHAPVQDTGMELREYEIPEFRLREHRRMRSNELHYFDHPRFGVIALITPYEAPEPETPQATEETTENGQQ